MTEKFEVVSKSTNLYPGSTKKNLGGINSWINNAKAESLGQGGTLFERSGTDGNFKVSFTER